MPKINSKNKGSTYERKIVKLLKEWSGEKFQRSPSSGAWSTVHKREDLSGDITCSNSKFKYSIECKKYKTWSLESLITSDKSPILVWWKQCLSQTPNGKIPLLIFSKNHSEDFCMCNRFPFNNEHVPCLAFSNLSYDLYIFRLSDLLETDPIEAFHE